MAIAAPAPTARVSVATAMITNIRMAVSTISYSTAVPAPTDGTVAPRSAGEPSQAAPSSSAAAVAPTAWAAT